MHAYLLIGKDNELIKEKAISLARSQLAKLIPFTLQKIADVKELKTHTKLSLSPTSFFIENIDEATADTLNTFLKQLEEPGKNVTYILTATSENKVLPTIVSRCQVVRINNTQKTTSNSSEFTELSVSQQLTMVDKIKKREEAIAFIESLIGELHEELLHTTEDNLSRVTWYLSQSQQTLTALEKNGNVTSQLSRLIVGINKEQ